ncbi:hypothetical protein Pmar_PMAR029360 [Perkinsus marinus ATCC 50983]|uniref:Uncharacterized protein n=1 Tax=Perkinsus marinus (strain ATCC 50983 / TXsc) TaxID=423536 RepID=C5KMX7_PERM5|nr:hypothetical protein Pmar_PMAR029360 [Perkinsus marinus ATCC 50983]EER14285.1 hypothetical protein Pmar_PMAR029360 [Perkinsus marinus ATCC 50983]|eukprot:XP_002782490.1 hypothetical protein Pmar_PMAR029360 [Perkinsus marinus ATCC 50983]
MSTAEFEQRKLELYLKFGEVEDTPTREQLSSLKEKLDSGAVPFADLSIFTVDQHERLKKARLSAWNLDEDGSAKKVLIARAISPGEWGENIRAYTMAMTMLGASIFADLPSYARTISKLQKVYPEFWTPTIMAADELMRSTKLSKYKSATTETCGSAFVDCAKYSAFPG